MNQVLDLESRARGGNTQAFGELLRMHDPSLRRVVWNVVRNRDAVDDVLQHAYEKAFRQLDSFAGSSSLKTWLHTICYRTALDHVRYEGRRRHDSLDSVAEVSEPLVLAEKVSDQMDVNDLLSALTPEARGALYLNAALGYTIDEVAEITGDKRPTVASRIRRAKELLRVEEAA